MTLHRLFAPVLFLVCAGMLVVSCSNQNDQPLAPTGDPAGTFEKASQRPITDFVAAQGLTTFFVPPVYDFMGWFAADDNGTLLASVDYAGVTDRYLTNPLGTTFSGSINERALPDGRAEVKVNLLTRRTLMYVLRAVNYDFATDPLLFGNRAHDVENGAAPGICDAHFEIVFKNTAPGAPLPDFMWALYGYWDPTFALLPAGYPWPGFELVSMRMNADADGPLHALAGLGPDGTPGHAKLIQVNLRPYTQQGGHGDQWPVENITLKRRP